MKVLVVDDEIDVKILFEQRFRKEIKSGEFDFSFAFSGEEALDFLRVQGQNAILILSDINMPGMSGLQLLEKIKSEFIQPSPLVYMITAYSDAANYDLAMQLGADDFLTKPIEFNILKEKLKYIEL
ncbi:MAG: response regulator [Saprospiraceae bacterium]